MTNIANEICSPDITDKQRQEMWLMYYFSKWGNFPIKALNDAHLKTYQTFMTILKEKVSSSNSSSKCCCANNNSVIHTKNDIDLIEFAMAIGIELVSDTTESTKKKLKEKAKEKIEDKLKKGFTKEVEDAINYMCAAGVAESAVGGGVSKTTGRRCAVVVLEESSSLAGAKAASKAFKALSHPKVNAAEIVASCAAIYICESLGVENPSVTLAASGGAGILTMIAAGAMTGGFVGAGIGAVIGTGSFVIEQTVSALFRTGTGPKDDWCYLETGGNLRHGKICAGVYAADDGLYFKTYQNRYFGKNQVGYFSAGQPQDEPFQVAIWDENDVCVKTYYKVYYRDTFFISRSKTNGKLVIILCKGGFNKINPGFIESDEF